MDSLATRTRVVSRKLKEVGQLPDDDARLLLSFGALPAAEEDEDAWVDRDPRSV
jgi:hypothetical protein